MATVVMLRHGRTTANTGGILAGRTAGVGLDEVGQGQAEQAARRLAGVPVARIVTSPLQRCRQTAAAVAAAQAGEPPVVTDAGLVECDYGEWRGRRLAELSKLSLWSVVQRQASAAQFPGGESMRAMSARVVDACRRQDREIAAADGAAAVWVAVSHGDLIKAVLADALGMHLDHFQRIAVDPASISIVRYDDSRPTVLATNTHAGDLGWLAAKPSGKRHRRTDETLGGGAGPSAGPPA